MDGDGGGTRVGEETMQTIKFLVEGLLFELDFGQTLLDLRFRVHPQNYNMGRT